MTEHAPHTAMQPAPSVVALVYAIIMKSRVKQTQGEAAAKPSASGESKKDQ